MSLIFRLFRASPFLPLHEHITTVQACAHALEPLFRQAIAGEWKAATTTTTELLHQEEIADEQKRALRRKLPKDLFLPVSRSDLLETLRLQDEIANLSRDIARLLVGRRMQLPTTLQAPCQDLLRRALKTIDEAAIAVGELDELVKTGFRGRRVIRMESLLQRLDELESDSDWLELELRDMLFSLERELDPVNVIFLYQLIGWLGGLADLAEDVGHRLQLMIAR